MPEYQIFLSIFGCQNEYTMRINGHLPELEVEGLFKVREEIDKHILLQYEEARRVMSGLWVLCLEGEMKAEINLNSYRVRRGDMITILPGSIVDFHDYSDDISLIVLGFAGYFFNAASVSHSSMDYTLQMIDMPVVTLGKKHAALFREFFHVIGKAYPVGTEIEHEIPYCLLVAMLSRLNTFYREQNQTVWQLTSSEKLYKRFTRLVMEHYNKQHAPSFYAAQLGVTPQHLNRTVHRFRGKTATEAIAEAVILNATSMLKCSPLNIRQIAESLGFADTSVFSDYFRRYVGMTPSEYRMK